MNNTICDEDFMNSTNIVDGYSLSVRVCALCIPLISCGYILSFPLMMNGSEYFFKNVYMLTVVIWCFVGFLSLLQSFFMFFLYPKAVWIKDGKISFFVGWRVRSIALNCISLITSDDRFIIVTLQSGDDSLVVKARKSLYRRPDGVISFWQESVAVKNKTH